MMPRKEMMMGDHTPGPWTLHGHYWISAEPMGTNGPIVEVAYTQDGEPDEQAANARLIAAAPDLLAACEQAIWLLDNMESEGRTSVLLRRVIAQATGQ